MEEVSRVWDVHLPEVVIRRGMRKLQGESKPEAPLASIMRPVRSEKQGNSLLPYFPPKNKRKQVQLLPVPRAKSQPRSRKLLFNLPQPHLQRAFTPPQVFLRKLGTELSPLQMAARLEPGNVAGPKVLAGSFQCQAQVHLLDLWEPSGYARHHWSRSIG